MSTGPQLWPHIDVSEWPATKRMFHRVLQMLGKTRLALSPSQPNGMFTALFMNARGVTTGFVPLPDGSLEVRIDVFASEVIFERSSGDRRTVSLASGRSVAAVFADVTGALRAMSAPCTLDPTPQEMPDTTPFHDDTESLDFDALAVRRWFVATTSAAAAFDRWRAGFFGRSGVQLWWGAFDLSLMLFNGKKVSAPRDRGYLMRYDLDAELMNVGLYFGDEKTAPFFYGYVYPEPPSAATAAVGPQAATWSTELHEWVLPYDAVAGAADPEAALHTFLDGIYEQCITGAGWDREALTYDAPPRP